MKTLKLFVAFALLGLSGQAMAVGTSVRLSEWPTDNDNNLGGTACIDSVGSVTGRDDATKTSIRTGVVDLRLTTGDTTTSFTPSAFNETATRIIDTSTPVRGLRFYMTPKLAGATHFVEGVGTVYMVGLSIYGKTAANLRQGYLPLMMGQPIVLENLYWYNTTGTSVSAFVESTSANGALQIVHMQVIR